MVSCSTHNVSETPVKKNTNIDIYYSPSLMSGNARTYMPMTPERILRKKHMRKNSAVLYNKIDSIIKNKERCTKKIRDNMSVYMLIDKGGIGLHQDKTISYKRYTCNVTPKEIDSLLNLMNLKVVFPSFKHSNPAK